MKKVMVKNIIIYDNVRKKMVNINISNFLKRTNIDETLKMILYYEYENHNIKYRDKIYIENLNCKENEKIELIFESKLNLGKYIVIEKNIVKPLNFNLFSLIDDKDYDFTNIIWNTCVGKENLKKINFYKDVIKEKIENDNFLDCEYANNGLLEMFYNSILEMNEFTSSDKIENKASAMCSYLAIREMFNRKFRERNLDYKISLPNVFIKGINTEFDALIVKDDNKLIYDFDDVYGMIEIKTKGYFANKNQLMSNTFVNYLSKNKDIMIDKIFIYLSMYESFGLKDNSVHYYNYLRANMTSKDLKDFIIGIFCVTKRKKDELLIPYEYDLDEIIDKVVKKIEHGK